MFKKTSKKIKIYLITVITQKIKKYYNGVYNLVVGKIQDETCGMPIKGFLRLKCKMVTFIIKDNHEYKIKMPPYTYSLRI